MTHERPLPNILGTIRETKESEVRALLETTPLAELQKQARARLEADTPREFESAVSRPGTIPNVIAEIKKASPSKGIIREDFAPPAIAEAYRAGGAAALSCLTDETYFQGKLGYLPQVREASGLPVLRKDFLIHEAHIWEAVAHGADAVLLIARMLDNETLAGLYALSKTLGMGVLLEIHDEPDLEKAMRVEPTLLGVNNRDLDTFVVDVNTTFCLREKIPAEIPVVAESGIASHGQLRELSTRGVAAVLVGEHLMRQNDIAQALRDLRGA